MKMEQDWFGVSIKPIIPKTTVHISMCDMIKGNELGVTNIDFELQAKRGNKFVCFT